MIPVIAVDHMPTQSFDNSIMKNPAKEPLRISVHVVMIASILRTPIRTPIGVPKMYFYDSDAF